MYEHQYQLHLTAVRPAQVVEVLNSRCLLHLDPLRDNFDPPWVSLHPQAAGTPVVEPLSYGTPVVEAGNLPSRNLGCSDLKDSSDADEVGNS